MAEKVETPDGCWQRNRALTKNGYAIVGGGRKGVKKYAHRVAFEALKGAIPAGLDLDHLCRNRACFNPTHLEPVTRSENSTRGIHREVMRARFLREVKACKQGHPYDAENTYWRPSGGRGCRACARLRSLDYEANRRQRPTQQEGRD